MSNEKREGTEWINTVIRGRAGRGDELISVEGRVGDGRMYQLRDFEYGSGNEYGTEEPHSFETLICRCLTG